MGFWQFWWRCFKWAFWRWDKAQNVFSTLGIYLSIIITSIFGLTSSQMLLFLPVAIFFVIVFIAAPYNIARLPFDELIKLKEKRLTVEINQGHENENWLHLRISNKGGVAIKDCYAKLQYFAQISGSSIISAPPEGLLYPFTSHGEAKNVIDLGANDFAVLDVAYPFQEYFQIPVLWKDRWSREGVGVLDQGIYEFTIKVGSKSDSFQPTISKLLISYKDHKLSIDKLTIESNKE